MSTVQAAFSDQMYKTKQGRRLNRSRDVEKYHKEVRENIESDEGKKIMTQRSIQAEGVFANLKQDYGIDCHIIWERKV